MMEIEPENESLAPAAEKSLTIANSRLAGSAQCMNCGTALQGPFCHYCGQPDKNFMRFFPVLLRELLEDILDFDSRFMRTIKPLLFKPGKLTRDYLDGRRFRYVPPLRLYIFSSIAFFFLAAILAADSITIASEIPDDEEVITAFEIGTTETTEGHGDDEEDDSISFNGKPWDRETNPLILPMVPDWVNEWVNDEIAESPQKGREIEANPDLIRDKVFDLLPATMFVLLPLVALLLKFWYSFASKYYVEHLIYALHAHSFLFVAFVLLILVNSLAGWQEPSEQGPLTTAATWANIIVGTWIPVYVLMSLKRVYQQGWGMTVVKFSCVGISYFVLLTITTVFVALLGFVLL